MLTATSMFSTIWCFVWLMPAEVNAFSKLAEEEPTDSIRTEIRGPRPARSTEPLRLPTGMDSSRVETWSIRARIMSKILDCNRLKAAMLL